MSEKETVKIREVTVVNGMGLHARPAAMIARIVAESSSEVWFVRENGERIMAGSALSILMMAAGRGTKLVIEADGADADAVADRLAEEFASGFGEID